MKSTYKYLLLFILVLFGLSACQESASKEKENAENHAEEQHDDEEGELVLHLSAEKFKALGLHLSDLETKSLSGYIQANGQLKVGPEDKASVTPFIAANVTQIKVNEGDKVNEGQVLGFLSHPDLIKLQTDYVETFHQLTYLEKEYNRQKRLYEGKVSSGKHFQKTAYEYQRAKGELNGLEAQLRLLGVNLQRLAQGKVYKQVAIKSPINGYVENINVQMGQYVPRDKKMFTLINTKTIHADFMVFEKDAARVQKGQTVEFTVESLPDTTLEAEIYAVGKSFEKQPKAVEVHARIKNAEGRLFPGMYISGKIQSSNQRVTALPEEAVITEGEDAYIFTARKIMESGESEWVLEPLKVLTGAKDKGWVEVKLTEALAKDQKVLSNKAYYIIAEMKKGQTSHHH